MYEVDGDHQKLLSVIYCVQLSRLQQHQSFNVFAKPGAGVTQAKDRSIPFANGEDRLRAGKRHGVSPWQLFFSSPTD